jgi:DNA repair protein RadD
MQYGLITPRNYQQEAFDKCCKSIRYYEGPFFVEASVGAGKTIIMGAICHRAQANGMKVLVLARRGELAEQNSETFREMGVKNSIFSASLGIRSTHFPVVVGTEGTVARALDTELRAFVPDICVFDECHEISYGEDESQYMKIITELSLRNPKLRIIGMTGSPYRGENDILGDFWKSCVYKIRTPFLVDNGFLVPTFFGFGHDEVQYDLSAFDIPDHQRSDYTGKELQAMQRVLTANEAKTKAIIDEVVELTKNRNAVMITGAGKKHLEQIASFLPKGSYVIITDSTTTKDRRIGLKQISNREKKYLLQVGCLTTGYDEPLIDTSVIMRRIGSLTLLVQLLGRGMRLLKPKHIEAGIHKADHLVLDYTDTMLAMADKYENPILEKAQKEKATRPQDLITCPECQTENSIYARRCIGVHNGARCEWFWHSVNCASCGVKNDKCARECRSCGGYIVDPNAKLIGKHYTDQELLNVYRMTLKHTANAQGVVVEYLIEDRKEGAQKVAVRGGEVFAETVSEVYYPKAKQQWLVGRWKSFMGGHLHHSWFGKALKMDVHQIIKNQALFDCPVQMTHRKNEKGESILYRKRFASGRETNK